MEDEIARSIEGVSRAYDELDKYSHSTLLKNAGYRTMPDQQQTSFRKRFVDLNRDIAINAIAIDSDQFRAIARSMHDELEQANAR